MFSVSGDTYLHKSLKLLTKNTWNYYKTCWNYYKDNFNYDNIGIRYISWIYINNIFINNGGTYER